MAYHVDSAKYFIVGDKYQRRNATVYYRYYAILALHVYNSGGEARGNGLVDGNIVVESGFCMRLRPR